LTDLALPLLGRLAWIDIVVILWIISALASTAYVA